jgi:hypothetical protein
MRPALTVVMFLALGSCSRSDKPASSPPSSEMSATMAALKEKCCAQCAGAASRDPAGMDISGKTCTTYPAEWSSGPGIDDECRAWFASQPQPLTVADCRTP